MNLDFISKAATNYPVNWGKSNTISFSYFCAHLKNKKIKLDNLSLFQMLNGSDFMTLLLSF